MSRPTYAVTKCRCAHLWSRTRASVLFWIDRAPGGEVASCCFVVTRRGARGRRYRAADARANRAPRFSCATHARAVTYSRGGIGSLPWARCCRLIERPRCATDGDERSGGTVRQSSTVRRPTCVRAARRVSACCGAARSIEKLFRRGWTFRRRGAERARPRSPSSSVCAARTLEVASWYLLDRAPGRAACAAARGSFWPHGVGDARGEGGSDRRARKNVRCRPPARRCARGIVSAGNRELSTSSCSPRRGVRSECSCSSRHEL